MSLFQRTFTPLRASARGAGATALRSSIAAPFHTSAARRVLSENDRDNHDRKGDIDQHKEDSIKRAKSGQGEWKPELASNSEQAVQGDKHNMTMEEMQKMGEKNAEKGKQPSGSSSNKA